MKIWVRSILATLLLACSMATAHAQTSGAQTSVASGDEMIDIYITFLPPRGSTEYRSLRQRADNVMATPTKVYVGELWKIHRRNAKPLSDLAKTLGATVLIFGKQGASPEQKAASEKELTESQKQIMAGIGDLASAVEFSIKQVTDFEILDVGQAPVHHSAADQSPMSDGSGHIIRKLRMVFDGKKEIVASVVRCEKHDGLQVWRGRNDATGDATNIYIGPAGMVTGEIRKGHDKYWMRPLGDGLMAVVKIDETKLPSDHSISDSALIRRIDALKSGKKAQMQNRAIQFRDILGDLDGANRKLPAPMEGPAGPVEIDVMVIYTPKVQKLYKDVETELVKPAIEQTNETFRNSGVDDVKVRLVHSSVVDYDETGAEHFDHVWRMVDRGDGYLEDVPALRNKVKADAVILIVDSPSGCGLTTRVAPEAEDAYAVVHHECAALTYSLTHEFGHILGARHDRIVDKGALPTSYAHGYVAPDRSWRSMMAYKEGCEGCPRLPIWSTPIRTIKGKPAGDALEDNARVIREQARRVSSFR